MGINNAGLVVGYSSTSAKAHHATLRQAGSAAPIDLNTRVSLSSVWLTEAWGINDGGQIIAIGSTGISYLLTPNDVVPFPLPAAA